MVVTEAVGVAVQVVRAPLLFTELLVERQKVIVVEAPLAVTDPARVAKFFVMLLAALVVAAGPESVVTVADTMDSFPVA